MGYAEIHFDIEECDGCGKKIPSAEGKALLRPACDEEGPNDVFLFLCWTCFRGGAV